MSQDPYCTQNVSMKLSEVLSDIGLNERIVMKRRKTFLLQEFIDTFSVKQVNGFDCSSYVFGSQSEGTTTPGLQSDIDNLVCPLQDIAIQDLNEFKPGVTNYLMIQGQTVSPGCCLLQLLRRDVPLPEIRVPDQQHIRDGSGKILLRYTVISEAAEIGLYEYVSTTAATNGTAQSLFSTHGFDNRDIVTAYRCKSWPFQATQWDGESRWPSKRMKKTCNKTGCLVVGAGGKGRKNQQLEWRISTCLAERYLLFSLNITQIQCYVLMKMLLKTYKPYSRDVISSFICKTVLFHTIANTQSNFWGERNLMLCLSRCLLVLYSYVLNENCPHFIIRTNNLMAGKITHQSKPKILGKLMYILEHMPEALFAIDFDDLGARFRHSFFNLSRSISLNSIISAELSFQTTLNLNRVTSCCLDSIILLSKEEAIQTLLKYIFKLNSIYHQDNEQYQKACMFLTPWFYTTLGSVLASLSIKQENFISANAFGWLSMGLNTFEYSSTLKLASIFYCIKDSKRTEIILRDIEENYDINIVEPICGCNITNKEYPRRGFMKIADIINEELNITAFCVKFLPCEINCVPHELKYELFRSTEDDLRFRTSEDGWMDLAVVDSLPLLYFLQYKIYSQLGRQDYKQRALTNILKTIKEEQNLGHRETALNLLGQCMEGEDRVNDAFNCYVVSLSLIKSNNAAKVHICRLLSKLIKNRHKSSNSN